MLIIILTTSAFRFAIRIDSPIRFVKKLVIQFGRCIRLINNDHTPIDDGVELTFDNIVNDSSLYGSDVLNGIESKNPIHSFWKIKSEYFF